MTDQPPEVTYNSRQDQPSAENLKIPELVDDSDKDQFANFDTLIHKRNQKNIWKRQRSSQMRRTLQPLTIWPQNLLFGKLHTMQDQEESAPA